MLSAWPTGVCAFVRHRACIYMACERLITPALVLSQVLTLGTYCVIRAINELQEGIKQIQRSRITKGTVVGTIMFHHQLFKGG